MKKTILILSFLLLGLLPAMAQVDTVVSRNRSIAVGKVEELPAAWGRMKLQRPGEHAGKPVYHPMKDISYVRFADGFRLDYVDGRPVRDNLLGCPTMIVEDNKILAEGLVRLNDSELKSFLGERAYALGYRPGRNLFNVGAWQAGIGINLFMLSGGFHYLLVPRGMKDLYYSGGKSGAAVLSFSYFFGAMAVSGIVATKMGNQAICETLSQPDMAFLSQKDARKNLWWGLAGVGAGVGLMALGNHDWNRHHDNKDQRFPVESFAMIVGGALLVNLGCTFAAKGLVYMSAQSKYKSQLTLSANGLVLNF